ncbi:DUF4214 domain-containing protein [Noviherbaspirillum galbum]|uniref:DUF4214 domain-containing protein n=1 Tax=Noviherbaspirillum galbum TaxID=2709383 RepID=A0A6B3SUT5_9BURK|nr:DUF4214 domain-containing protein [Noviherbaspirillum galbum]NEX64563.1 DUF4214 domain-containing protein [Noviherbaspirillum galbum]
MTESMRVERVDVTVNVSHPFVGDLGVLLRSPKGTTSFLLWRPAAGALSAYGSSQNDIHFTFDTVLDWGEDSVGTWQLGVSDMVAGDTGTLLNWTLNLIGAPTSPSHTFVYTNEYGAVSQQEQARKVLSDPLGSNDTINIAALGGDCRLDLTGATTSLLNDAPLTIASGTPIRIAIGGAANDTIIANNLGDTLRGNAGNDTLIGGGGIDSAVYAGNRSQFAVTKTDAGYIVVDNTGVEGTDTLTNVERLIFADAAIALDTSNNAGQTYRLYQAAFNRKPDVAGIGWQLKAMDAGTPLLQMAKNFMASAEFQSLYGANPSTFQFVTLLYNNVLHRSPQQFETDFWMNIIDKGVPIKQTTAEVLMNFSESAENQAQVVGSIKNGIEYHYYSGLPVALG